MNQVNSCNGPAIDDSTINVGIDIIIMISKNVVPVFTGVRLKLLGRAKVHWSVRSGKNSRTHYRSEEIYIDEQTYVFGSCE